MVAPCEPRFVHEIGREVLPFEFDDGGAKAAGFRITGDCVPRAIAIATGVSLAEARDRCGKLDLLYDPKCGERDSYDFRRGTMTKTGDKVLKALGWVKVKRTREEGRLTFTEVARKYGTAVVKTTRHWCAIKDGVLRDRFDSRLYAWEDSYGDEEIRERTASTIWIKA